MSKRGEFAWKRSKTASAAVERFGNKSSAISGEAVLDVAGMAEFVGVGSTTGVATAAVSLFEVVSGAPAV